MRVLVGTCVDNGARGFALAVFILSVFPRSLSPPHVIVFRINPLSSLRASRRLVRTFFSFVTPLFQRASFIETERNKKEIQKDPRTEVSLISNCLLNELISLKLLR